MMSWLCPPAPLAPSAPHRGCVIGASVYPLQACTGPVAKVARLQPLPLPPALAASHCWAPWHRRCHPHQEGWRYMGVHRPVSSLETSTAETRPARGMEPQAVKSQPGTGTTPKRGGKEKEG